MVVAEWRPMVPLALDTVLNSFIFSLDKLGRGIPPSSSQRVLTTEALIEVQGCQMR